MARREIQQMVRRIVSRFHPEKIILFGSHARGDAGSQANLAQFFLESPLRGSNLDLKRDRRPA